MLAAASACIDNPSGLPASSVLAGLVLAAPENERTFGNHSNKFMAD
jgi:hypothetical protein